MFYSNPVALDKVKHHDLRLDSSQANLSFATQTHSVMLAGMEFQHAAKEYPIIFIQGDKEQIFAAALLGVRTNENLYIGTNGRWNANYVPAFVRRYPFILAKTDATSEQLTVCIDSDYPGFNNKTGEPLFEKNGEPTAMLTKTMRFLQECQENYQRTEFFIKRLKEMDLFVTISANIETKESGKFTLQGLLVVDEKKLLALEPAKVMELFGLGELGWIYAHLISLANINRLANLLAQPTKMK